MSGRKLGKSVNCCINLSDIRHVYRAAICNLFWQAVSDRTPFLLARVALLIPVPFGSFHPQLLIVAGLKQCDQKVLVLVGCPWWWRHV
jgi:hypothetical protein